MSWKRANLEEMSKLIQKKMFKRVTLPHRLSRVPKRNKCTICETKICGKCWEIIPEAGKDGEKKEHVCDPDILETVNMLKDDTKPCPVCSTRIFKVYGCSQMYCTNCKTAFDWNTGKKLEVGRWFHNPHLDEELREGFGFGGECGQIDSPDRRDFANSG